MRLLPIMAAAAVAVGAMAADFAGRFADETLRIDLRVSPAPDSADIAIAIDSVAAWPRWYGRRANLDTLIYPGSLQVALRDSLSGDIIYIDSKSPEALSAAEFSDPTTSPLHCVALVPKPLRAARLEVAVTGDGTSYTIDIPSADSLTLTAERLASLKPRTDYRPLPWYAPMGGADYRSSINLAIVPEGYTAEEWPRFLERAAELQVALFAQPGFQGMADRFNIVVVEAPSAESGVTIPSQDHNVDSRYSAHFDSYGLERLMIIPDTRRLWDDLEGVPAAHIIVLANTEKYGGSGSYNEYAISAAERPGFTDVVIHEFGHSFAFLADEYESGYSVTYTSDFEPYEPNITTLCDFSRKWPDLIATGEATLIEGAGYQASGVWRGAPNCLMRSLADRRFCPVCARSITHLIHHLLPAQP